MGQKRKRTVKRGGSTDIIYNFYLYDRRGNCLFYREWNRPFNSFADNPDEDKRLVYGLLFSLKSSIQKLSGAQDSNTENINYNNDTLATLSTDTFTLHHIESPSGLRLVLITDNSVKKNLRPQLWYIYANIYVTYVVKSYTYKPSEGAVFIPKDSQFGEKLEDYIQS